MISEVVAGVLTDVVVTAGHRAGSAALGARGRQYKKDAELARWFDTHKLTGAVPELPSSWSAITKQELAWMLEADEVHAVLHELLAARLTQAPETGIYQIQTAFTLTLCATAQRPDATGLADVLFRYYDAEIRALVGRLARSRPDLLRQIRQDAAGARMISILHAIERHVAALSGDRDLEAEADFLARYRRHVAEYHGMLEPPDFDRRRRIPVGDLYVSPAIMEFTPGYRIRLPRVIDLWQLDAEVDRTVLLGDPGSGKTTAAHVLCHRHATAPGGRVPFLVTLREFFADGPPASSVAGHIEHRLAAFYQCPPPAGMVSRLLLSGRALVVFDGLDELTDTTRRAQATAIVERFSMEYPLARVLVTSRLIGYEEAQLDDRQFACYRIGNFDDKRIADYARKWFAQEPGASPAESARQAARFMEESAEVPDLRSSPLMLALMCILYRGEGSLPRNRSEVYQQCASLLFKKWDTRRHISVQLRAGPLVEPALRHLAYWLLTRGQLHSAVTEQELISEATSFLHVRGFEDRDHAAEAAQEFVAFCRNRAWVFSDAGSRADGQRLYAFTHRTFLEYFAAAHLSALCDTPEELVRELEPRITRQEWEVVAELAARIKADSCDRGAQRFYTALLASTQPRPVPARSHVLQFLARSLRSLDPPPAAVRELTRAILDHLFAGDVSSEIRFLPLSWLLAGSARSREVVRDQLSSRIAGMVACDDPAVTLNGLRLAVWVSRGAVFLSDDRIMILEKAPEQLASFWDEFARDNVLKYATEIITAAREDDGLMYAAIRHGLLSARQVISWPPPGLTRLFMVHSATIFDAMWIPYLVYQAFAMTRGWTRHMHSGLPIGSEKYWTGDFQAVGQFLAQYPEPPWVFMPRSSWYEPAGIFHVTSRSITPPAADLADPLKYLGAATAVLIAAELFRDRSLPEAGSSPLGCLDDLYPYILRRWQADPAAELPQLPLPNHFQNLFTAWADPNIDFVCYTDD